ncbi:MAG: thioredoxin domain-containing protein [Corynebacterium sp.]|uniref:DsbA family protein n=1 Tax=Corynebacterium sp. TaxID=1720 RepID=UPI0026DF800C|nr:thioredoxin domain-containing protein [Corynebacterium sp.]MDO5668519.1 thioredoxin domain-containing protein [Corynebacterium sp.]
MALIIGFLVGRQTAPTPAAAPVTQEAPATTEAQEDPAELARLAAEVTPGTRDKGPQADAAGRFDATITGPGEEITSAEDVLKVHRRDADDPFAVGALDAPVVISEFSDFECPFCSRFANTTEPALMDAYVDAGLVRFEWNDMPVNGPMAEDAAKAGRAAAAQGKFQEYKKVLFTATAQTQGHPNHTIEDFVRYAGEAGVPDLERFRADATDGTFDAAVEEAKVYGASIGVNGTPSFFIGESYISGAQPTEVFEQIITEELAKVARGDVNVPEV